MMVSVQAFADASPLATAMADLLGAPFREIAEHVFPDGETLPTALAQTGETVVLVCSLDHPNRRLIPLLLAADALRRQGAARLVLVAPYLCYMRQDKVFSPGQPLSRDVVGSLLGHAFDRVVTVDAHLHRTRRLADVFGGVAADDLSAAAPLADALAPLSIDLVIGPDVESRPWALRISEQMGAELIVMHKDRTGDRTVRLSAPDLDRVAGRRVALVDDICASGATLIQATEMLKTAGAASVALGVTHALFDDDVMTALTKAGAAPILSTDSVRHPTNKASLARLLADALQQELTP